MESIKVLLKHYPPGMTFREKGMILSYHLLVAFLERIPTEKEISGSLGGKKNYDSLIRMCSKWDLDPEYIAKKTLEDVENQKIKTKQKRNKKKYVSVITNDKKQQSFKIKNATIIKRDVAGMEQLFENHSLQLFKQDMDYIERLLKKDNVDLKRSPNVIEFIAFHKAFLYRESNHKIRVYARKCIDAWSESPNQAIDSFYLLIEKRDTIEDKLFSSQMGKQHIVNYVRENYLSKLNEDEYKKYFEMSKAYIEFDDPIDSLKEELIKYQMCISMLNDAHQIIPFQAQRWYDVKKEGYLTNFYEKLRKLKEDREISTI